MSSHFFNPQRRQVYPTPYYIKGKVPLSINITTRICLILLLLFFTTACLPEKKITLTPEASQNEALSVWERYNARANAAEKQIGPFRISASLRYSVPDGPNGQKGQSARVSSILWGNGRTGGLPWQSNNDTVGTKANTLHLDAPYTLRLDLLAGAGNVVAKVIEDKESLLAYIPNENTAYVHTQNERTLASFGVPIPLSLSQLTALLSGHAGTLFLPQTGQGKIVMPKEYITTENGIAFHIQDAPLPGMLELSFAGIPLTWYESDGQGWQIHLESQDTSLNPRRVRITYPNGYLAIIVIREIEYLEEPFTNIQLALPLPPQTMIKQL